MFSGRPAMLLAAIALVGALIAALSLGSSLVTKPVPVTVAQTYFSGNYSPKTVIDIGDINIGPGQFTLAYSFTVTFTGPSPSAELVCELKDPNGVITEFIPSTTERIRSSLAPQRVSFAGNYQLPYVDVGIRCHTSVAGAMTAHFSHILLGYSELG